MGAIFSVLRIIVGFINFTKTAEKPPEIAAKAPAPVSPETPPVQPRTDTPAPHPAPSATCLRQGWSKDIRDCDLRLQAAWDYALPKFLGANPAYSARVDYTWRSAEFQLGLFAKGRHKTGDGSWVIVDKSQVVTYVRKGHHNVYVSQAFDFIIFKGKKPLWACGATYAEAIPLYTAMGKLLASQGVVSGAIWKYNWKDWGHVQSAYNMV